MKTVEELKKELPRYYFLKYLLGALMGVSFIGFLPLLVGGAVMLAFAVVTSTILWMLAIGIGLLFLSFVSLVSLPFLGCELDDLKRKIIIYENITNDFFSKISINKINNEYEVPDSLELTLIDAHSISAFEYYCSNKTINENGVTWFINRLPECAYTIVWLSQSKFESLKDVKSLKPYTVYCSKDTANKKRVHYKLINPGKNFIAGSVDFSSRKVSSSDLLDAIQRKPFWEIQSLELRGLLRALDNPASSVAVLTILFLKVLEGVPPERRSKVALVFAETVWNKLPDKTGKLPFSLKNSSKLKENLKKCNMGFLSENDKKAWGFFCDVLFSEDPRNFIQENKNNSLTLTMKTGKYVEEKNEVFILLNSIKKHNSINKEKKGTELLPPVIVKKIFLENFGIFPARNSLKIQDDSSIGEEKNILG